LRIAERLADCGSRIADYGFAVADGRFIEQSISNLPRLETLEVDHDLKFGLPASRRIVLEQPHRDALQLRMSWPSRPMRR